MTETEIRPRVFVMPSDPYRPVAQFGVPSKVIRFERRSQEEIAGVPDGLTEMDGDLEALSPTDGKTPTGQIFEYWFGFDPHLRLMLVIQTPGEPWQLLELGRTGVDLYEYEYYEQARIALWDAGWQLVFDLDAVD